MSQGLLTFFPICQDYPEFWWNISLFSNFFRVRLCSRNKIIHCVPKGPNKCGGAVYMCFCSQMQIFLVFCHKKEKKEHLFAFTEAIMQTFTLVVKAQHNIIKWTHSFQNSPYWNQVTWLFLMNTVNQILHTHFSNSKQTNWKEMSHGIIFRQVLDLHRGQQVPMYTFVYKKMIVVNKTFIT